MVVTMQTGIQKLSNLDAVIISQSNPDQNFYGESLDLTDSMLLIKPGFNKDEVRLMIAEAMRDFAQTFRGK